MADGFYSEKPSSTFFRAYRKNKAGRPKGSD